MNIINIRRVLVAAIALAFVVPVMSIVSATSDEDSSEIVPRDQREWTVMLYMGSDSSYYEVFDDEGEEIVVPFILGQCERAFAEAEIDPEEQDVNLVVLVDRTPSSTCSWRRTGTRGAESVPTRPSWTGRSPPRAT
ncbi:MAG: hypothetical protein MUE55_08390 [Thermoplasmata archaeon]|nr:hypothetical protein [Thermoplasmata archaeon]